MSWRSPWLPNPARRHHLSARVICDGNLSSSSAKRAHAWRDVDANRAAPQPVHAVVLQSDAPHGRRRLSTVWLHTAPVQLPTHRPYPNTPQPATHQAAVPHTRRLPPPTSPTHSLQALSSSYTHPFPFLPTYHRNSQIFVPTPCFYFNQPSPATTSKSQKYYIVLIALLHSHRRMAGPLGFGERPC